MKTEVLYTQSLFCNSSDSLLPAGVRPLGDVGMCLYSNIQSLPISGKFAEVFFFENNLSKGLFIPKTITKIRSVMFTYGSFTFIKSVKSLGVRVLSIFRFLGNEPEISTIHNNYGSNMV